MAKDYAEVSVGSLMDQSGVKFGTSGARGLAVEITDLVAYVYTKAFLQHLRGEHCREAACFEAVALGGDLRPSTDRIMAAAARAVSDMGLQVINCGKVPSPALAYYGLERKVPTVMVTGSHIPDDRNGIKYTRVDGEISKDDEAGIRRQIVSIPSSLFDENGMFCASSVLGGPSPEASELYVARYLGVFPSANFNGQRVGVYQHSAVGRDIVCEILRRLGAEVLELGRSEIFIPVDTEAIREEDCRLAAKWAHEMNVAANVYTDGDSDRPLISDETGRWIRGDISGILTAAYLKADAVAAPVSCNSALEKSGLFKQIIRTRIGSPYVIAGMELAAKSGANVVVGYEANGGFLLGTDCPLYGRMLKALPTRDAVLVHLALLSLAAEQKKKLSELASVLPQRFTASDRIKDFPAERSQKILASLSPPVSVSGMAKLAEVFAPFAGAVSSYDVTDGLRVFFAGGDIIHLRPSGNAPEFRCYTEAESEVRATELLVYALNAIRRWNY